MLIQELFRRAAAHHGSVLEDIAATLAPTILREFGAIPALGGSGKPPEEQEPELLELLEELPAYTAEERQRFSSKGFDQSLSTHLINGLFAGMKLAGRLPEYKKLDETEQRVWVLGYTVHDYTKAYGRKVEAGQLPAIRRLVSRLGERLAFDHFMANWSEYLDDIVFLAQNTQTVQGANLNLRDYQLQLDKRQRETARMLSSVTDLLVHITSPSDVHYRDVRGRDLAYNLRTKLDDLFSADLSPRLGYHKLLEVRGLLSNLLNNAVIDILQVQGYEPFLFFPEGAIYLVPQNIEAHVDLVTLTSAVWERIAGLLTGGRQAGNAKEAEETEEDKEVEDEVEGGLRITRTKDYMKVPPMFYELLSAKALMEAGRQTAMAIRNSKAAARFGAELADDRGLDIKRLNLKQKDELFTKLGREWAVEQQLPTDVRVDQLAEYLGFLYRRIFAKLFPKLHGVVEMMLGVLGLADEISSERAERQRGGTPTGWFYVAARYLQQYPALDPDELGEVMNSLAVRSLQFINDSGFARPNESENRTASTFQDYAQRIIEIDGSLVGAGKATIGERFINELQHYIQSKAENKIVCSLCASPYEASEQDASVVLFKPQQYSNKSPLDRSRLVRGICQICALEMMLRQVQQGLPASKTQDKQPINLYLYPTYFFTTETAQVIKQFANRLQNLDLFRLIFLHLERQGFSYRNLFNYEDFLVDEEESNARRMNAIWKPQYSDEDLAALFFITFRPLGRKLTETDTWIVPTFFAQALPLLLGIKCVVTPSFVPLYGSASDFQETVRLDGAHQFTKYIVGTESLRIDELSTHIERLLRVYSLHIDVYREGNDYHWGQLTGLVKDLATDPLYVFQYYDRRERHNGEGKEKNTRSKSKGLQQSTGQRSRSVSQHEQQRYMGIYYTIGGNEDMGFIGSLVDTYAQFYRSAIAKLDSAYAVLRPLGTAIEVVVESDPRTETDDLLLLLAGAINDDQERVRSDQAEGFDPIVTNKELGDYGTRLTLSRQKINDFAQLFLKGCFEDYCDSDRAVLRERANRIRSAARFYYLTHYGRS